MDCKALSREIVRVAGLADDALSPSIRRHLAECATCARALAAERLCRGLVRTCEAGPVPPPGFAARVAAALPRRAEAPIWRPAWGLIPAFAAAAAALVVVYGATVESVPAGLLPVHELTAGERLVFQERGTNPDAILSAILEGER